MSKTCEARKGIARKVAKLKRQLGKKLFRIALLSAQTKADDTADVRATKGRKKLPIKCAVELIGEARSLVVRGRSVRRQHHAPGKIYYVNSWPAQPGLPLEKRLARYKRAEARRVIGAVQPDLSGRVELKVRIAADFGSVTATAETRKGDYYSKHCSYRQTDGVWDVAIQPRWTIEVARRGLAKVDGMPTLAALPVETPVEGEEVYRAKWLENGRGFGLHVREGYIVRRTIGVRTYTAHAPSIAAARSLITRQTPESERATTERATKLAAKTEALQAKLAAKLESGRLNGYAEVVVTIGDSLAVGNCSSGTRAWIARNFPGRKRATIEEIIGVADQHHRVLRACIRAIARQELSKPAAHEQA